MVAENVGTSDGVIADVIDLIKGDVPSYVTDTAKTVLEAAPALMVALAGIETDPLIALPYLKSLFGFAITAFEDYAAHRPEAAVKKALDDAIGDLLENVKFGPSQAGT
jgi:hypothetical protein